MDLPGPNSHALGLTMPYPATSSPTHMRRPSTADESNRSRGPPLNFPDEERCDILAYAEARQHPHQRSLHEGMLPTGKPFNESTGDTGEPRARPCMIQRASWPGPQPDRTPTLHHPSASPVPHGEPTSSGGERLRRKKRARSSRACDECRRRKSRCDAVFEVRPQSTSGVPHDTAASTAEGQPPESLPSARIVRGCMNCDRSGIECAYTKRAVKRTSATKGYLKALEARLSTLESQLKAKERESETNDSGDSSRSFSPP
ncbi:hypothetical protein OC842_002903 [Tilletia horrida]|uniref:Zn(2)-C6 fungal-type domain-containing protein n=1 Tax=Tilletia horrida TaxID=155126 RepID=A0AAN6GH28_9BASI|nr:hypothetical protein OC842_002903 [Tilletia horrida]